jgi:hypothetical protein
MQIVSPDVAKILIDIAIIGLLLGVIVAVNLISQAKSRP